MTWRYHTDASEGPLHVWPEDDLIDHELDSDECVCGPTVEVYTSWEGDRTVVIHHALDGRRDHRTGQILKADPDA